MYTRVGNVRLFFDVEGAKYAWSGARLREKPTLLCLHGGPGLDHSSVRRAFSALGEVAQVVYLDQRGHGRSDRSTPEHWHLQQWADDVHSFCQALGIDQPIVLGTSFGGYIAMMYAIRYPYHPKKLILISTALRGTAHPVRRARVLDAFERIGGAQARQVAQRLFDERTGASLAEYLRVCGPLYNRCQTDSLEQSSIANHEVLHFFERPDGEGALFNLTQELWRVQCPTLILGGADDPITPPAEQEEIFRAISPEFAKLDIFPNCGHGISRDDRERLLEVIAGFLD